VKKGTKKSGSISQMIRDYAAQHPDLGPTQIAKDLEAQGHRAYPALVSQALRGSKKKTKGAKRGRKPGSKNTASKAKVTVQEVNVQGIKAVSEFVKLHGSADDAIASIRSFQKLSALFR